MLLIQWLIGTDHTNHKLSNWRYVITALRHTLPMIQKVLVGPFRKIHFLVTNA